MPAAAVRLLLNAGYVEEEAQKRMSEKDKQGRQRPLNQKQPTTGQPSGAMSPGDQAPPGTPGTGENLCPVCGGEGSVEGRKCVNCGGTGVVTEGIGGA